MVGGEGVGRAGDILHLSTHKVCCVLWHHFITTYTYMF